MIFSRAKTPKQRSDEPVPSTVHTETVGMSPEEWDEHVGGISDGDLAHQAVCDAYGSYDLRELMII